VEGGRTMENATAISGTGAKPVVPETAFFDLLLQELGFCGVEKLETFCLKSISSGETLPGEQLAVESGQQTETLPVAGNVFATMGHELLCFSAGILPNVAASLVSARLLPSTEHPIGAPPYVGHSLIPGGMPPDAGHSLISAEAPLDAKHPLPLAADKQPFIPAAVPDSESGLRQKISLSLDNSGTNILIHGEGGKPPIGELTDFFPRHGEKKQIPSGQVAPERVVPAVFSAYGGVPQQDLGWFPGGNVLAQPENVLEQILVKIQHFSRPGTEELQIKLYPETLGEMKVKVRSEHGALMAEIIVSHAAVKEMLEGQLDLLRQRFKQLNLPVDLINVLVEYGGQEGPPSQTKKEPLSFDRDRVMIGESGNSRGCLEQQPVTLFAGAVGINVLA
jgi:hypothetical protein